MHLVVDAVAARKGSAAIVVEHLVRGWCDLGTGDRITVITGPTGPEFELPDGVQEIALRPPVGGQVGGLWMRSAGVRRASARLGADAVLSGVPASSLLGTHAPRGIILYDLRHELRPHQFTLRARVVRRVAWGWSMRRADGIYTISERTLADLRRLHPSLAGRGVAAQLGADHVDAWRPVERTNPPYAVAFGHFANKNIDAVLAGWAGFCADRAAPATMTLRLVGMGATDRAAAAEQVRTLGIAARVQLMPWLDDAEFEECFAGASLVVFPSDFEGFGLPAVEAQRLAIPVVISPDTALAEVTGGHAVVARSVRADDLAAAMGAALAMTPDQIEAGRRHTDELTWRRTARTIRESLLTK